MEESISVPQKLGPQYNPSSALGSEARDEYQYGKDDHGARGESKAQQVRGNA